MPMNMPPTMEEREAELAALQSAFDEYIASSRELEEELDAELAKMQEKLADSSAANAALSGQLENIAPQLASLEKALSDSRAKLKVEQKLRRQAEQDQDELEAKYREVEGNLLAIRDECDAVHEELAFKESELEETRLELEIERERHAVELEDARAESAIDNSLDPNAGQEKPAESNPAPSSDVDEAYVKKLEDELELVTEQLIETEALLSQTEEKLNNSMAMKSSSAEAEKVLAEGLKAAEKDKKLIQVLQEENATRLEEEHKLREELELTKEELVLTQEELRAVEYDAQEVHSKLDDMRAQHRLEVNNLKSLTEGNANASKVVGQMVAASEETDALKDEISRLNEALKNAKKDRDAIVDELEAVNERFDEAREEAEKRGRELAASDVRAEISKEREAEISDLKDQLKSLTDQNTTLQQKIDDTEMSLAAAKDSQSKNQEGVEVQSELVKELQSQLNRSKEEVAKKEKEMTALVTDMEERVDKAEETVTKLEQELSSTKGKLAEAEAHLIVSKREAEVAQSHDLTRQPSRRKVRDDSIKNLTASSSVYHPDIMIMDEKLKVSRSRRTRSNSPNAFKRLELKLSEEGKKYKELEVEFDKLKEQQRMGEAHVKRLEEDIKVLQRQLYAKGETGVSTNMSRITAIGGSSGSDLLSDDTADKLDSIISSGDPKVMGEELRTLQKRCNAQRDYNNQLLSKMLNLQGNIQVFCRIRPTSINEIQNGSKNVVESLGESELGCFDGRTNKWKSFAFDRVWGPDQGQQSIFQDVEPIALSVVDGFNACIFAYGQTGSGKTYTMEGVAENNQRGISYRTIQKVFHLLSLKQQQEKTNAILFKSQEDRDEKPANFVYNVEIGMLEIYNDECYDLLGSGGATLAEKKKEAQKAGGKASLEIRRNKEGRIEVPNLTKESVNNIEDVFELLAKGNKNRATASTSLNQTSSRSHMVLWVDITSGFEGQDGNKGTLFLVDLAGSERVKKSEVEGDHMKEAGHINKSLSALGNVMEALDRKASHVPYRDSKLTYLLQDSLGGNSRTMMIVAVTPVDIAYDESIHALQFATRVRRINIGAAQRNVVTSKNLEETVKALTDEMKTLARQKQKTESQMNSMKKDNARIQDKLSNLNAARKAQASDSKTLEVLRKNNNEMAKRWEKEKNSREEIADELDKSRKELRKLQKSVTSLSREQESLKQKLDDKDKLLEKRTSELRTAKEASAAANLRARKAQVLGSRARPTSNATNRRTPAKGTGPSSASSTTNSSATSVASTVASAEVAEIRADVLKLLEKHDKGKVNRIDIIMEKFKGKEHLLLEKMTQRYENAASGDGADVSTMSRGELAAKRHAERMRKLRESKK